jgi:hypothetical protein
MRRDAHATWARSSRSGCYPELNQALPPACFRKSEADHGASAKRMKMASVRKRDLSPLRTLHRTTAGARQ